MAPRSFDESLFRVTFTVEAKQRLLRRDRIVRSWLSELQLEIVPNGDQTAGGEGQRSQLEQTARERWLGGMSLMRSNSRSERQGC